MAIKFFKKTMALHAVQVRGNSLVDMICDDRNCENCVLGDLIRPHMPELRLSIVTLICSVHSWSSGPIIFPSPFQNTVFVALNNPIEDLKCQGSVTQLLMTNNFHRLL